MSDRFQPYAGFGEIPTTCCKFAVVDVAIGQEVCRVWHEEDARRIARLLNQDVADRSAALDALAAADAPYIAQEPPA